MLGVVPLTSDWQNRTNTSQLVFQLWNLNVLIFAICTCWLSMTLHILCSRRHHYSHASTTIWCTTQTCRETASECTVELYWWQSNFIKFILFNNTVVLTTTEYYTKSKHSKWAVRSPKTVGRMTKKRRYALLVPHLLPGPKQILLQKTLEIHNNRSAEKMSSTSLNIQRSLTAYQVKASTKTKKQARTSQQKIATARNTSKQITRSYSVLMIFSTLI